MTEKTLYATANRRISFDRAMQWAGQAGAVARDRGVKVVCPVCGEAGALRVYPDHGWCFAEQRYFSPVGLLAEVWEMDREHAAVRALGMAGYVPTGHEALWEDAQREPAPALDDLATALRLYCRRICPDWVTRQYDDGVSGTLAKCLGVLSAVRTEEDCRKWLTVCKTVMGRALSGH
jgi:hypothetical protein